MDSLHRRVCLGLDRLLRRYQAQDPELGGRIQRYQGQAIKLSLKEIPRPLWLVFTEQGLHVVAERETEQCTLNTSLFTLPRLRDRSLLTALIKSGELNIDGDVQLAQTASQALGDVHWEAEAELSHWLGDAGAHLVWRPLQLAGDWLTRQRQFWRQDLTEWVQDEIGLLPHPLEISEFCAEVDKLETSVEQFADRLRRIEQKWEHNV